jgi:5-methylthioadenosine/S-adenosylhomocysteine deaminase
MKPAKSPADLIVTGGIVVAMDGARTIYHDGAVVVKGDTIVAVGPRSEIEAKHAASDTIDARGKLILPGLINGHTHVPMTLFRGLHDDVTLDDWLRKYIFPAEARNVNEDFVRWGTRLALAEQVRSGVTTFADMYYYEDAVAEETKAAGMRAVLGETWIDFPAPDNKSEAAMAAYTEKFLKKWAGDPLIHAAVAPHSIYTCSAKTLNDAAALTRKYHAPLLIHVAEMKKELDDSLKQNGLTPVEYLDKLGILGPDVVAAHCIFVDDKDRQILAKRQVGCVHNPSSNMMLASGVSPVREMRAAGVAVGLGTDGPAGSNNDLDLMEEMDLVAKLAKIAEMNPLALNAKAAVEMATIDGARAMHMDKDIGSLEPGKKADLIVIALDRPNAVPMYDVYAQVAYALKASDVDTVVIGGRPLMRDHKLLTVDEAAAVAKAREYQKTIADSLGLQ